MGTTTFFCLGTGTTTDHNLAKESDMGDMDTDKYSDKSIDNYRKDNN